MLKSFWNKRPHLCGSIVIFMLLSAILGVVAHGQTPTTSITTIKVDLASFVASQYVHKYYPEFQWHAVDYMALHDINGSVKAYAFIFAKVSSDINSSEDLQLHIQKKFAMLWQAKAGQGNAKPDSDSAEQARARVIEAEEALYNYRNLGTVITGATSDSELILNCFRGLPQFWVNAETTDEAATLQRFGKALQIVRIIMITPMDFRLVATKVSETSPLLRDLQSSEKTIFPDTAYVLESRVDKVRVFSDVKKERQAMAVRKQQRLRAFEPAERAEHEKALEDRARAMADKWRYYREMLSNNKKAREVAN
ncbi:MAG TPA: hypothetical protein VMW42_12340 [Desulfatiglandales bacterium]|nr:hypothetical protein [Desulfatiglandales bacterium]